VCSEKEGKTASKAGLSSGKKKDPAVRVGGEKSDPLRPRGKKRGELGRLKTGEGKIPPGTGEGKKGTAQFCQKS